jgi:F0F1-type ATP synthase gamma subunit
MNVKAVVKVMNFHALLRVEASRNRAELLNTMQEELEAMMRIVFSNQNLKRDKSLKLPDPALPVLQIYLGSDFGFCGSVNSSVSAALAQDSGGEQVVVGKKLRRPREVSLFLTQEEFNARFEQVRGYLERAVREQCWSGVELIYNHYYNLSSIKLVRRRIYPLEVKPEAEANQWDDFAIEGDVRRLLEDISYLTYELKIAADSAYASENIMRQNATSESLKKLDELEQEQLQAQRKERTQKAFQKTIDSYIKQKSLQG